MKKNLDLEYLAIKLVLGIINELNFYKGFSNAKNVNISSFLKPWKKKHTKVLEKKTIEKNWDWKHLWKYSSLFVVIIV